MQENSVEADKIIMVSIKTFKKDQLQLHAINDMMYKLTFIRLGTKETQKQKKQRYILRILFLKTVYLKAMKTISCQLRLFSIVFKCVHRKPLRHVNMRQM